MLLWSKEAFPKVTVPEILIPQKRGLVFFSDLTSWEAFQTPVHIPPVKDRSLKALRSNVAQMWKMSSMLYKLVYTKRLQMKTIIFSEPYD